MWQGLGGGRPVHLDLVSKALWLALWDSAIGRFPLSTRLRSSFRQIEAMGLADVAYPDSEWLSGGTLSSSFCGSP